MFDGIGSLFNQNSEVNIGLGDPIDRNMCVCVCFLTDSDLGWSKNGLLFRI